MKRKLLTILLAILAGTLFVSADDSGNCGAQGDNLTWYYNETALTLTISGTGDMADYSSTSLISASAAPWKNYREIITSVILPEGLTHIGNRTFYNFTSLTSVTIPHGVTSIGLSAFAQSGLTDIVIPNSVISIGEGAFRQCASLTSATLSSGLTTLETAVFSFTGLTSITIPNSVTSINNQAFSYCEDLKTLVLGTGVTNIASLAFHHYSCALEEVTVLAENPPTAGANAFDLSDNAKLHISTLYAENYTNTDKYPWYAMTKVADFAYLTAKEDPANTGVYYNSFFDSNYAYALPAGVEAYIASVSGETLLLTKIAEAGRVLPANTAVIFKSERPDFTLDVSDAAPVTFSASNSLLGTNSEMAAPENCYVLSAGDSGVGFYQYNSANTLKAHKAYIVLSGASAAPKRLRFVFDAPTGMEQVQRDKLQGKKVLRDGQLVIEYDGRYMNIFGQTIQ